jgi:hypothetical protein
MWCHPSPVLKKGRADRPVLGAGGRRDRIAADDAPVPHTRKDVYDWAEAVARVQWMLHGRFQARLDRPRPGVHGVGAFSYDLDLRLVPICERYTTPGNVVSGPTDAAERGDFDGYRSD